MENKPTKRASSSGEDHTDQAAQLRIDELEQQVAQLQEQLQGAGADPSADSAADQARGYAEGEGSPVMAASRFRVVLVGVITSLVILTVIFTLFSFLSKGFDSAARRAAEVISPQPEGQLDTPEAPGTDQKQADQDEDEALTRPPGL